MMAVCAETKNGEDKCLYICFIEWEHRLKHLTKEVLRTVFLCLQNISQIYVTSPLCIVKDFMQQNWNCSPHFLLDDIFLIVCCCLHKVLEICKWVLCYKADIRLCVISGHIILMCNLDSSCVIKFFCCKKYRHLEDCILLHMNPAKQLHINSSLTNLGSDSMSEEVSDK
jgi:hypothetical protein